MREKDLLIKNGHIISPADGINYFGDILIKDGMIDEVREHAPEDDRSSGEGNIPVFDASDLMVSPGFVDVHTHFRDPGESEKEDIHTGAAAAMAGGYTTVICMANTVPAVDSVETLEYVKKKAADEEINILQCGTVTKERAGKELNDLRALKAAGAAGFTDDGSPILDEDLVREAMKEAASIGAVLSFHEEDPYFIGVPGVNNGEASRFLKLKGADREAEISMVKRDIRLCLETGCRIDIQHVSAAETVELIREGKKQDKRNAIHAEATPNHFSMTEDAVKRFGALAKINPPLRTEKDRLAIIEGLKDGTIDIIATDHAPHTKADKTGPFEKCKSGIIGLETAFSLGLKNLVNPGFLTLEELIERMSVNPAALYGLNAGHIRKGHPAALTIFSTVQDTLYDRSHGRSDNSPFLNERLPGRIVRTVSFKA